MTPSLRSVAVAAIAATASCLASAQPASAPAASASAAATASTTDRRFVQEAGAGGAAEVALGKLAAQKGSRDEVKQVGQHMIDDHTKAGNELKQIAGGKGMTPPEAPTPAQQKTADRLAKLSGASFDTSYLNQMVLDHKKTIAVFRNESRSGRDPELKAFAAKTLPTLEEHLKMVRSAQTKGGAMNRASNEQSTASAPR